MRVVSRSNTVQARRMGSRERSLLAGEQGMKMDRPKAIQVVNDCQRAGKVLRSGQAAPKGRIVVKRTWAKAERSGGTSQKSTRRRDRGQDRTDDEVTMWYPGAPKHFDFS